MSNSCLVLDAATPYQTTIQFRGWCPRSERTAVCNNVTNVMLDLSGVPDDIQVLCLRVDFGLVLQPDTFARFHSLRRTYIQGRLAGVFPGAFRGLTRLLLLSLVSPQKTNLTFASKALHDLHSLEQLTLKNYALSGMAPDVFDGLDTLRHLDVLSPDERLSELLCRLVNVSVSLETLRVTMGKVETLGASNCSAKLGEFPALHNISISFPNIKAIEIDALRYFKRISELSMPMNDLLQTQLLESGTQRVDSMDLTWMDLNVEFMCEIALAFSVTDMSLCFSMIQESSWGRCQSLESLTLTLDEHLSHVNLSFIHTLTNLKTLVVFFYNTGSVDETLSSLCSGQNPLFL